jgi:hypothetical protein
MVAITDEEQRWQESLKLEYDWHKNMITLSAGIPIVIAALVSSDFFPNKLSDMSWLIWSLGLLAGSILCSLLSMIIVARFMRLGQMKTGTRRFFWLSSANNDLQYGLLPRRDHPFRVVRHPKLLSQRRRTHVRRPISQNRLPL